MSMSKTKSGFTIVELLIVIVVIAILAAISIVAYNGIQDRAVNSTVKSDLTSFDKKMKLARVDTSTNGYPLPITTAMGITASKSAYLTNRNNWYYCITAGGQDYAIGVVDLKNRGYFMSSMYGLQENQVVGAEQTCNVIGTTASGNYTYFHSWNGTTSTGTWSTVVNG